MAGETTRDLVIRIRLEKIGDGKMPVEEIAKYTDSLGRMGAAQTAAKVTAAELTEEVKRRTQALVDAAKAELESAIRTRELANASRAAAEAQKDFYIAFRRQYDLGGVEMINRLARGYTWLTASNKDSAAEIAKTVLKFQAQVDIWRGGIEIILRLKNAYAAMTAALHAYHAALVAGAGIKGASFLGMTGMPGALAAGGASVLSMVGAPILASGAMLGGGLLARRDLMNAAAGKPSWLESTAISNVVGGMTGGALDFSYWGSDAKRPSMSENLQSASYYKTQQNFSWDMLSRNEALNLQASTNEFELSRRIKSNRPDLIAETRNNIRSGQAALAAGTGERGDLGISNRVFEDFRRLETLLQDEAQAKEESARKSIQAEHEKLNLLNRELAAAQKVYELKKADIDRGATAYSEMRPFEQARVQKAFAALQAGQTINRKDRQLLRSIGTDKIDDLLQQQASREAFGKGFGNIVSSEMGELFMAKEEVTAKEKAAKDSEANLKKLRDEAKKTGEEMANQITIVMAQMLEAFKAKTAAERTVESQNQSAQRAQAGK